ncbi:MAG: hypothetical protein H6588_08860 [Flavobacteriales bacterium]|nr:hypothetical protein [Flavobacteriales bacterium]
MPIPIRFLTLIVPKKILTQKYKGGYMQYKLDCPNKSYLEDDYITAISFMGCEGLVEIIDNLKRVGLSFS